MAHSELVGTSPSEKLDELRFLDRKGRLLISVDLFLLEADKLFRDCLYSLVSWVLVMSVLVTAEVVSMILFEGVGQGDEAGTLCTVQRL